MNDNNTNDSMNDYAIWDWLSVTEMILKLDGEMLLDMNDKY